VQRDNRESLVPKGCLVSLEVREISDRKDHADFKVPQVLLERLDQLDHVVCQALEDPQESLV